MGILKHTLSLSALFVFVIFCADVMVSMHIIDASITEEGAKSELLVATKSSLVATAIMKPL